MKISYQCPETAVVKIEVLQMIAESDPESGRQQEGLNLETNVEENGPGGSFDKGQGGGIRSKDANLWDEWD